MRRTSTFVCSAGHLVKAEGSQISIDSLCRRCKSIAQMRARGLRSPEDLARSKPHGTRLRYIGGCRCDLCRRANTQYESSRARARASGDWNGIVDATKARAHLKALSSKGVGRRAVRAATDISDTILSEIRSGRRKRIRARTERLILGVGQAQALDRALVPAARTWKLIDELLEEGYTRTVILTRLGYRGKGIQLGRERVTVRNAARIERLHRELTS